MAKYADSFDDIEEKGKEITVSNIEEIEVSTGRFNNSNFQKELSEEEFNLITANEKFRSEIVETAITSISSSILGNFERQVECLKLNPNIYHEKFVEIINNLRDYLEITITDSNGGKLAVINPKTYEITNLKSYKTDEYICALLRRKKVLRNRLRAIESEDNQLKTAIKNIDNKLKKFSISSFEE